MPSSCRHEYYSQSNKTQIGGIVFCCCCCFIFFCLKCCWLNGLKDKEIRNIVNSLNIGQVVSGCLGGEGGFCHKTSLQLYCYFFLSQQGWLFKKYIFYKLESCVGLKSIWSFNSFWCLSEEGTDSRGVPISIVVQCPWVTLLWMFLIIIPILRHLNFRGCLFLKKT